MKITIKKDFRGLKEGDVYDFTDIKTCLVAGDNGCGKSSLFHALRGKQNDLPEISLYVSDYKDLSENIEVEHSYEKIFFLDSITDDGNNMMVSFDACTYVESMGFATKDKSHGESGFMYLSKFLDDVKNNLIKDKSLVIFDEIDKGFSLEAKGKFSNILSGIHSTLGVDIITITHDPIVMLKSRVLFDFQEKTIGISKDYINKKTGLEL